MSKLIKIAFCFAFSILLSPLSPVKAQINTHELPPSFYESGTTQQLISSFYAVQKPNIKALEKQDAIDDLNKEIAWRFGVEEPVNKDLLAEAKWRDMGDGNSQLKLAFYGAQAKSINLNFKDFHLSPKAKLFFYNFDYSDVLGAITAINNKENRLFSTRPISGELLNLELICPNDEIDENSLILSGIVYGYRSLKDKGAKTFGQSGNCNIDINCPEGVNWQDIKRSVVMLLTSGNTRFCTGTLINNVRQDSTPYILTADHCNAASNSIFVFNYESPGCNPSQDGSLSKSISGATSRALYANSDFQLFELSATPPANYNVFYAGWNASNIPTAISTAIHHPSGDVMKISIDQDMPITSGYYTTNGTSHWTVANWEKGTTEGGSSGSALFDSQQRIIGQLHGGNAACGNNAEDYYGKFAVSWNSQPSSSQQLKAWLDPDNTGVLTLNGMDPNPSPNQVDLGIIGIENLSEYYCGDSIINPKVLVKNLGNDTINSINLIISIAGYNPINASWTGQLARNGIISIPFQSPTLLPGPYSLSVNIANSIPADTIASNNSLNQSFFINPQPIYYSLTLKTDNYGDETSWDIRENGQSIVIASGGPYAQVNGGATYTESLCLYDSCFSFNIYDSFGDGFNDASGNFGNGFVLIRDINGDTAAFENNFTTAQKTLNFCVPKISTGIKRLQAVEERYAIYPNPLRVNELLKVESDGNFRLEVLGINGQKLREFRGKNQNSFRLNLKAGLYLIRFIDEKGQRFKVQKLIVQ